MQQPVVRRDAYEPSLTATISGREVGVAGASMDRALPDPLAGGQLRSASGSFTAVEGPDVTSTVATPWDIGKQWPPVPQSDASVSMDAGSGPVSLLGGGLVVSAEGGTSGREVEVEVADRYESLNRTISWDNVAAHMPSLEEGEYGRYVGMQTTAVTNTILDHCGWYSTPPSPGYTMLRVPAQGSMWPDRGYVTDSQNVGRTGYVRFSSSDWGVAAANVDATYTLRGAGYSIANRGGVELAAMTDTASESQAGDMYMDARSADWSTRVRLQWSNSQAYLRYWDGSAWQNAVYLNRADGLLYGTFEYVSSTSVKATLRNGGQIITEVVSVPSAVTSGIFATVNIWGEGRAGGFLFCAPTQRGTLADWKPNAVLYPRATAASRNALEVRPSIEGENCADLLAAQCEAECATYWIDETGVLRWWDLGRLESQSPVATLGSDDDIAEAGFTWSHDRSQVKSRVSVKWRQPLPARSWRTSIDLHQGRGETLQGGDVIEDWLNVPDDEIWIMPDLTLSRVGDSYSDFNYGIGSWYGGIADRGDGIDTWAQLHGSLLMTVERVTDSAFKTWVQWTGTDEATLKTLDEDGSSGTGLWKRRRDFDLPIIRGKLKFTLAERITYSVQSGPSTAPEHEIDAGWWIQNEEQAQYTADYAGQRLTVAQPVLSSVALIPVPGLQLGDVVTVVDTAVTRLTIRGIVIEDSRSISADMDMGHDVTIRPTWISRNGVTWEMWGDVVNGKKWQTWGNQQDGKIWQDWGAGPLAGEDVI